jgi:ribosomal protein L37AE/L43A
MSDISVEIDKLAEQCCEKMTWSARTEYFRYQKRVREEGKCIKKRYEVGNYYYKGKRRGQLRDVYEVKGDLFNQLWKKLYPYAITSIMNSGIAKDRDDAECIASDMKAQAFYVLRSFGSVVRGKKRNQKFSGVFRTIVINVLQTTARRRGRVSKHKIEEHKITEYRCPECGSELYQHPNLAFKDILICPHCDNKEFSKFGKGYSTRILFDAVSINSPVNSDENGNGMTLEDKIPSSSIVNNFPLIIDVPDKFQSYIFDLLKGKSIVDVAKQNGYRTKERIAKFRSDLQEAMGPVLQEYFPKKLHYDEKKEMWKVIKSIKKEKHI